MFAYATAITSLSLCDLYREVDRLNRLQERWSRIPYGESQVEVCQKQLNILAKEIGERYANGKSREIRTPLAGD